MNYNSYAFCCSIPEEKSYMRTNLVEKMETVVNHLEDYFEKADDKEKKAGNFLFIESLRLYQDLSYSLCCLFHGICSIIVFFYNINLIRC
jgi:hypothetical protein